MRRFLHVCFLLSAVPLLIGQTADEDAALRKQALEMMEHLQVVQAAPILEGLAARHPNDLVVQERLGMALLGQSAAVSDLEAQKKLRIRARNALLRAKELGDNSDLLNSVLPNIRADGTVSAFSDSQQVEAEMHEGENQFAHGDLQAAIAHYQKAFELDPKQYYAPLFAGDASFKLKDYAAAATWFNRAIAVQPDLETAHRYFADSLLAENKIPEARTQFIEAIVADPYNQRVWLGLNNLKAHVSGPVQRLHFQPQASVKLKGKETQMNIDPSALGEKSSWGAFWVAYAAARAAWRLNHESAADTRSTSAAEESAGYEAAIMAIEDKDSVTLSAHPELARLKKVQAAGLLYAWVLIDQPDQDIAQDYADYRAKNRDKLRRYLDDFVVPKVQ